MKDSKASNIVINLLILKAIQIKLISNSQMI